VYAKRRKLRETNVCSLATPKNPRKIAPLQSKSTRAVWQASDSVSHNSSVSMMYNGTKEMLYSTTGHGGVALLRRIGNSALGEHRIRNRSIATPNTIEGLTTSYNMSPIDL